MGVLLCNSPRRYPMRVRNVLQPWARRVSPVEVGAICGRRPVSHRRYVHCSCRRTVVRIPVVRVLLLVLPLLLVMPLVLPHKLAPIWQQVGETRLWRWIVRHLVLPSVLLGMAVVRLLWMLRVIIWSALIWIPRHGLLHGVVVGGALGVLLRYAL